MIKYKGFEIYSYCNCFGRKKWAVGTRQDDGSLVTHAKDFNNTLSAKRAADANFGKL